MKQQELTLLLVVAVILVVLFIVYRCKIVCKRREGFVRSMLGNQCNGLQRSPVDYAFKHPHGWQRNPHYQTYPGSKYQPLGYSKIDFSRDIRRLNKQNGVLFQQYTDNWNGVGKDMKHLSNDIKNRMDLTTYGNVGLRAQMDDMYNPSFGPKGIMNTEQRYVEPSPFEPIYGGFSYLRKDRLTE